VRKLAAVPGQDRSLHGNSHALIQGKGGQGETVAKFFFVSRRGRRLSIGDLTNIARPA
jgi:hypothetical protein